jgi:hypothetical protein
MQTALPGWRSRHRVEAPHTIRESARDRIVLKQISEACDYIGGRPFDRFIDHRSLLLCSHL